VITNADGTPWDGISKPHGKKTGHPIQTALADAVEDDGRLNPDWVEWLMGWPIGWTSFKPLARIDWPDWAVDPADTGETPRTTTVKTNRVDRLKAIGNGQVPACAAMAWNILKGEQ